MEGYRHITGSEKWTSITQIHKGWSRDRKYAVETVNGDKLLLRTSDYEFFEKKRREFDAMKQMWQLGIPMSEPLAFGEIEKGGEVYLLLSWIEGDSLDEVLSGLTEAEQYQLGVNAGKLLKTIHSIPAPLDQEDWEERMLAKTERYLEEYEVCPYRINQDECVITYIKENVHLLKNRTQTMQHGDFHVGNFILMSDHELALIDFNRWDYGDTIEEFYKMVLFSREVSIPFVHGQLDGYYEGTLPSDFFSLLAFYMGVVILSSITWAMAFKEEDVQGMLKRAEMIVDDYDCFQTTVPKWYVGGDQWN